MEDLTKTLIAIPAMDYVATPFLFSLVTMQRYGASRVSIVSNSLVYQARNMLAAEAIDDGCDWILWLDSDMAFGRGLMTALFRDAEEYGADYVSGLYFKRQIPTVPLIKDMDLNVYLDYPTDAMFEVGGSGFGAVLTSARMVKDVYDRFGPPFTPLPDGTGEDFAFCHRARELGYKLWCDSRIKLHHVGHFPIGEEHFDREAFYG